MGAITYPETGKKSETRLKPKYLFEEMKKLCSDDFKCLNSRQEHLVPEHEGEERPGPATSTLSASKLSETKRTR